MKIKKGDTVLILRGKDRKKTGKVMRAIPSTQKIVVEGLNLVKKHQKPRKQGQKGEVALIARAIPVSNVKLICPKCQKATRVGYSITGTKKERMCKKCKAVFS